MVLHSAGTYWTIGEMETQENVSGRVLGSAFDHVGCYSLKGLLRDRKGDGFVPFSVWKGDFCFSEGDMIQRDLADLHGPKP